MGPAELFRLYLVDRGVVVDPEASPPPGPAEWPAGVGGFPASDVDSGVRRVSLLTTGGVAVGRYMDDGSYRVRPSLQVRVRAEGYDAGEAKAAEVVGAARLLGLPPAAGGVGPYRATLGGTRWVLTGVNLLTPPARYGQTDNGDDLWSVNLRLFVTTARATLYPAAGLYPTTVLYPAGGPPYPAAGAYPGYGAVPGA